MIFPRFTLLRLLGFMSVCALVALVAASAARGEVWGVAACLALAGMLLGALVHAALYLAAYVAAVVVQTVFPRPQRAAPFAHLAPAPRLIEPPAPT